MCGTVPTSPHFRSASQNKAASRRYWRRLSFRRAHMSDSPVPIIPFAGDFIASDDERLFAFIDSLRKSVNAKVIAGQRRGLSLSEIVAEVREMVRFADDDPDLPRPFQPTLQKRYRDRRSRGVSRHISRLYSTVAPSSRPKAQRKHSYRLIEGST